MTRGERLGLLLAALLLATVVWLAIREVTRTHTRRFGYVMVPVITLSDTTQETRDGR